MSDPHKFLDVWEAPGTLMPWRCQAVNGTVFFSTQEAAEKWRDAVAHYRKEHGLKV